MIKKVYIGLHVQYRLFLSDFNDVRQIFEKSTNIKFHEKPSGGSRVVPYGRTDSPANM
jgi:hypothetical protein